MPRRRRKYRPQLQEQEKPEPFFARPHPEEPVAAWLAPLKEEAVKYAAEEEARAAALYKLQAVKGAINHSLPDQALVQQSKALELANQMLAADIWDISVLQQILARICRTLAESQFICGPVIARSYGSTRQLIQLGHAFKQLRPEEQVRALLREAVKATALPELYGMPTSGYENTDRADAWVAYLCTLLELLPEQPYLITGTPTNGMPPMPAPEAPAEAPTDNDPAASDLPVPVERTLPEPEEADAIPDDLPETENLVHPREILAADLNREEEPTLPAIPRSRNVFQRIKGLFSRKK